MIITTGRLFASSSCSRLEGWDCSSLKAERELGLVRRETALILSARRFRMTENAIVREDLSVQTSGFRMLLQKGPYERYVCKQNF